MKITLLLRSGRLKRLLSGFCGHFLRRRKPEEPSTEPETPPAPPVSLPPVEPVVAVVYPPRPRSERTLVIGVDYGTSSTKVIWQDLSDNHFEVFQWQPTGGGLASALLPSMVRVDGDLIHLGFPAQGVREGDVRLPSIKLCVLCRRKPSICGCGSAAARHGLIRLPGLVDPIPASSFACLFLAHVFREVEGSLVAQFPDDELFLIWNIGCPMDHLDVLERRAEWERIAGVAMELRNRVSNPANAALLTDVTRFVESFSVPASGDRNYLIQPEGLATVKAFLESPHAESKTYAIIDVGAGTTDVSFFFNGKIMSEPGHPFRPSYLADSTEAVGGGKIDRELAAAWGSDVEEARQRKEAGRSSIPFVPSIGEICAQYEGTCCEILKQHKLMAPHDKKFDLFVTGGGGRLKRLKDALQSRQLPGGFVRENLQQLKPPRSLKNRVDFQEDFDFLAVACGLASSLYWDYYRPGEVGPMPPKPPSTKPKPDVDEYYPK